MNNVYPIIFIVMQAPFPLYPEESLVGAPDFGQKSSDYKAAIKLLPVIKANHAIRLKSLVDHMEEDEILRKAEEIWQLEGPLLYHPTPNAVCSRMISCVELARTFSKTGHASSITYISTGHFQISLELENSCGSNKITKFLEPS